jgi:hypothetical protein
LALPQRLWHSTGDLLGCAKGGAVEVLARAKSGVCLASGAKVSVWVLLVPLVVAFLWQAQITQGGLRAPLASVLFSSGPAEPTAKELMIEHSKDQLHGGIKDSTMDKMRLKHMDMKADAQIFRAPREKAKNMIKLACEAFDIADKFCKSMAAATDMVQGSYHKKDSTPLDGHKGMYLAVWIWVRTVGHDDEVEVAIKTATMAYQLRDVVEYVEKVEYEPIVRCEKTLDQSLHAKGSVVTEHCREVSRKEIRSHLPVFTPTVLTLPEMDQVDKYMEGVLAEKAIQSIGAGSARRAAEGIEA